MDISVTSRVTGRSAMSPGSVSVLLHNSSTSSVVTWDSSADCHVVPYYVHVIIGIFVAGVALFASVGNFLVLCTYARHASLWTSSNMLVINLTVADLFMSSINFPMFAVSSLRGCWMLGYVGCQIYGSTSAISGLVTINTLAVISLDRYIVVVHRFSRVHRMAKSKIGCIIALIWMFSITWSVLPLTGLGSYRLEGMGTSCTFNYVDRRPTQQLFFMCLVTFNFFIPLMMIIFSYWRIYLTVKCVKQELKLLQRDCSHNSVRNLVETQSEIRTAFIAIVIIFVFCVAWTPYVIISFIGIFGPENTITPLISALPNILAKTATISNPLLYTIGHPDVRKRMKTLLFAAYNCTWRTHFASTVNNNHGDLEVTTIKNVTSL